MSDYTVDSLYQRWFQRLIDAGRPDNGYYDMNMFIDIIECHLEDGSHMDHVFTSDEFDFLCRELVYNNPAS